MTFQPRFCPRPDCPSHSGSAFCYRRRGVFQRLCDRRVVPRFLCLACGHGFSLQSFRVDYRLKRPELLPRFFADRVSKVTHRQSARIQACSRATEERHFRRLAAHCQDFHSAQLLRALLHGGLGQTFLLDELETYEHHRLRKPVTVPVLIEHESGFVVDARVGTLASRERSSEKPRPTAGVRRSQSRRVVQEALQRLFDFAPKDRKIWMRTDHKPSYAVLLRRRFGRRCVHEQTSSRRRRDLWNPLWPINHTLARLRDGVSRLVRETWAAAKLRGWLAGHIAIWICFRNYVRGRTNRLHWLTPAMALGLDQRRWSVRHLLQWRLFPHSLAQP